MLLDLPRDILQFEILHFLPLRDVLHLQYAVPRTEIISEWKKIYYKVRSCSIQSRDLSIYYFGKPFDHSQFQNAERVKLECLNLTENNKLYNFRKDGPLIITHAKVQCLPNTSYTVEITNRGDVCLYRLSSIFNEKEADIIVPVGLLYTESFIFFETNDPKNCKVIFTGYRVNPDQLRMKTTVSSPCCRAMGIPKFVHFVNRGSLNQFSINDTIFNKRELQIMWNMCKTSPRRFNEITIPCNLNLNDERCYFFDTHWGNILYERKLNCLTRIMYFVVLTSNSMYTYVGHYRTRSHYNLDDLY